MAENQQSSSVRFLNNQTEDTGTITEEVPLGNILKNPKPKRRRKRKKKTVVPVDNQNKEKVSEVVAQTVAKSDVVDFTQKANTQPKNNEPVVESSQAATEEQTKSFSYLETYCKNITEKIGKKIDDFIVYGRDQEVEDVQIFLKRSIKNSPVLVGEAGVGKTAIVDGFCANIIKGNVDKDFIGNTVWSLEMAAINSVSDGQGLVAKLDGIVKELKERKSEYILFIDEIHTIIGSGGEKGGNDAGQSLKTALARGEIRIIGATTQEEYERFLEPDKALERRFQLIPVEEPTHEQTRLILDGVIKRFEREQKVTIEAEAIEEAIRLSVRYIPERFLPDKALDLLDEASATVSFHGGDTVTRVDIARVIERLKRIPLKTLIVDENLPFVDYEEELKKYVKGQDVAVKAVSDVLYAYDEGLNDPNRPIATFMFLGTTGVGKTEMAKALAKVMFGSKDNMIRIDCSEYQDPGDVKKLIGDNNHASQGILTSKVKKNPYSIVLLDEFEKADKGFYDAFLQVLDDGHLTTGLGRKVDFKNTIVIVTTNAGHEEIKSTYKKKGSFNNFSERDWESFNSRIDEELTLYFREEFINRFSKKIVFDMLTYNVVHLIAGISLDKISKRMVQSNIELIYKDKEQFYDYIIAKGASPEMGARPMERLLKDQVVDQVSKILSQHRRHGKKAIVVADVLGYKPDGITQKTDRRKLHYDVTIQSKSNVWVEWKIPVQEFRSIRRGKKVVLSTPNQSA